MGLIGGCCLALIAIILPPFSVAARTGCDHHFIINIILTILGWIPGVFHAWYIILRFPNGKRSREPRVVQERVYVERRGHNHQHGYPPPPPPNQQVYYAPQESGYRHGQRY